MIVLNWLNIGVGVVLGFVLSATPIYFYGKYEGKRAAAIDALEKSVEILVTRGETNESVSLADATELCSYYGLSADDEAECVRRLREANSVN